MMIPRRLLLASGPFAAGLSAERVAAAIARGVVAAGLPQPDRCPLEPAAGEDPRAYLDSLDFDARMRAARAVVVAVERLEEQTLAASVTFEIATRARQSGVPAYAIAAADELSAFDARILDLQVILRASSARALSAAGRKLATLV
jgi:glycerate 2-kinase